MGYHIRDHQLNQIKSKLSIQAERVLLVLRLVPPWLVFIALVQCVLDICLKNVAFAELAEMASVLFGDVVGDVLFLRGCSSE